MSSTHYHPSGRFSPIAIALLLLVALLSVPLAWLYAWSALHLKVFLVPFAALGFALLLLLGCASLAQVGKMRNPALMMVLSLLIGLTAWYCQWAQWAIMAGEASGAQWPALSEVLGSPESIFRVVQGVKGGGVWAVLTVTMEFLLLAILPALIASNAASQPFCETSKTWVDELKLERRFAAIADTKKFIAALEAEPDRIMALLEQAQGDPDRYVKLSLFACDGAPEAYVSVWDVIRKGSSESRATVLACLRIAPDTARRLLAECDSAAAQDPVELAAALEALHAENYSAALAAAAPFCDAAQAALRNDANRVCALSASRLEQWTAAAGYWQALFEHETSSHNAAQVASSLVMAGALAEGEQWFARALAVNQETGDTPQIHSYTNFISALQKSGQLRAALPYLEWVRDLYQSLHITDSTFLTIRGVPFFVSFLDKSAPIVAASMDAEQARAWYAAMLPHIDQDGQDQLNTWLAQRACA